MEQSDSAPEATRAAMARDFRLLMAGRTFSLIGASMTSLTLMLVTLDQTGSASAASGVAATSALGGVIMALPAGALVDRLDRRPTMVASAMVLAVALASVPMTALIGPVPLWQLFVVSLVVGVTATFYDPAEAASIKRLVAPDQLGEAMTINQVRGSLGSMIGGPLAGALYSLGRWVPLIGDAIANVIAAVLASVVRSDLAPTSSNGSHIFRDTREGLVWLFRSPGPRQVAIVLAVNMFGIASLITGVTLGLRADGQSPTTVGLVQTVLGAALLLGSLLTPLVQRRASLGRIFLLSSLAQAGLTFVLLWTRQPVPVLITFGLLALTGPASPISLRAWFMAATPDRLQGRATSALMLVTIASTPLSTALTGFLLDIAGPTVCLIPALIASFVTVIVGITSRTLRSLPRIEQLPHVSAQAEATN